MEGEVEVLGLDIDEMIERDELKKIFNLNKN